MKSIKLPFLSLLLVGSVALNAQEVASKAVKYRRSSLHMIMIEDAALPNAKVIKDAFISSPLPDKYNDHSLPSRSFVAAKYALTAEEKAATGAKADGKGKSMVKGLAKGAASSATGGLVDTTNTKELPLVIEKYLNSGNVAKDLVAKWFGRDAQGGFNMNLIGERGMYDASALDLNKAKASARGMAVLADAGEELIKNTFVVVTRFNYVSKKEIYDAAQKLANAAKSGLGGKMPSAPSNPALEAAKEAAYKKATEGYIVQSTSYLFQLNWNDSVSAVFYNDLWMDASSMDAKKKEAFDKTNLFTMKYIGDGKALAQVPMNLKVKRSEEELVKIATINASDAVVAKLQRDYEVFKTKVPLFSGNPITAKIGLKEGLEAGDKFEVLEQTMDEKTGKTVYKKVGKIKVDKDLIWDNRANAGEVVEETPAVDKDGKPLPPKPVLDCTTFKGGSKFYSGMLIRQVK
jgi:hypothetical protein